MIRKALALAAVSVALSGCVTLLPKAEPATLYRLSLETPPAARPADGSVVTVIREPLIFPRTVSGDRIMTVTGDETAAIAGARWAAPAQIMFDEAMTHAFDGVGGVRLARGGRPAPDKALRVEVRSFEARYLSGPEAAPTVVIEARAMLNDLTGTGTAEQVFRAEVPASANRVSAIVEAYNAAAAQVLNALTRWTETAARTAPAP